MWNKPCRLCAKSHAVSRPAGLAEPYGPEQAGKQHMQYVLIFSTY
jgi:hypothetical protein